MYRNTLGSLRGSGIRIPYTSSRVKGVDVAVCKIRARWTISMEVPVCLFGSPSPSGQEL